MNPYILLERFDKQTEEFIDEEEIQNIDLNELSKVLNVSTKALFIGGYIVDQQNVLIIEKICGKKIDLKKYIYNFEIRKD